MAPYLSSSLFFLLPWTHQSRTHSHSVPCGKKFTLPSTFLADCKRCQLEMRTQQEHSLCRKTADNTSAAVSLCMRVSKRICLFICCLFVWKFYNDALDWSNVVVATSSSATLVSITCNFMCLSLCSLIKLFLFLC